MAEQATEHETDDVFMIGDLQKKFSGVNIGFIPIHLKPRLSFEVTMRTSGFTFYDRDSKLTTIGVYLDGKFIGGICIEITWGVTCRTWAEKGMQLWNAEKFSDECIQFPFKCGEELYHPTFHTLSDLLLYHLSEGV